MLSVLMICHTCSPVRGSEHASGWNWAWHVSRHHQVQVIAHPKHRVEVEAFLAAHPNPNLRFAWATVAYLDPWRPEHGDSGVRLHYVIWQWRALAEARRLGAETRFDVVHHVGWGTLHAPPPFWRLGVPFVWGPVGGGQTAPANFRAYFGKDWPWETFRSLRVRFMPSLSSLRRAVRESALILATNRETAEALTRAGAASVVRFLDSGVESIDARPRLRPAHTGLNVLWAGRAEPRKALPLAIEALAQTPPDVRLTVAGDGPTLADAKHLAERLHLQERIRFLGWVAWSRMRELYRSADVFLFTSLRDSFGAVLLEAMSEALPIVTLDHQGAAEYVPADGGFKIPVTSPAETTHAIGSALTKLAGSAELRAKLSGGAHRAAASHTWENRAKQMSEWYDELAARHRAGSLRAEAVPSARAGRLSTGAEPGTVPRL